MKPHSLVALRLFALSLVALAISYNSLSVRAQKPGLPASPVTTIKKGSATKSVDPEVARRRSIALGLLTSLAIEARSYRDEALRARVQARVADALWIHEPDNARALFRRAWEAAEAVETQNVDPGPSAPGRISNRPVRPRTNLRAEILRLAAQREHGLGEEFLKRMTGPPKDETSVTGESTGSVKEPSPAETRERLRLANVFLEAENVERALQFADPVLLQVSTQTVEFLVSLREKNAASADQRFAALMSRAAANPASDANTVSLLTSYVFTPSVYLVVSSSGIPSSMSSMPRPAPVLSPALRSGFFQTAANILLRPFAQLDSSSAGRAGTYFIATRLFPLFQQYAPELAPAIGAQLNALGPQASQATLNTSGRLVNLGMTENDPSADSIADELKDRLSNAQGADARDRAYAFAAVRAAEAGDLRAREFLDRIEDLETGNGIRSFVDYRIIGSLLTKKNAAEAVRMARKSDLSHALRAHVLTQAAAITAPADRVRALELFDEALSEARRTDAATPERAYLLVALLAQFSKVDRVRAWGLTGETIKAANAVEGFTGENGNSSWTLEGKFSIRMSTELASDRDLPVSFAALAEDDFYQSIDVGRNFSGDAPRALVTLAIARAMLEEKRDKAVR
jgi:hypothetical protein